MITHTNKTKSKLQVKKIAKNSDLEVWQATLH